MVRNFIFYVSVNVIFHAYSSMQFFPVIDQRYHQALSTRVQQVAVWNSLQKSAKTGVSTERKAVLVSERQRCIDINFYSAEANASAMKYKL